MRCPGRPALDRRSNRRGFLERPRTAADDVAKRTDEQIVIVHSDLKNFYDRVRPRLLQEKLRSLRRRGESPECFELASRVLNWRWDRRDRQGVNEYQTQEQMTGFDQVALPQPASSLTSYFWTLMTGSARRDRVRSWQSCGSLMSRRLRDRWRSRERDEGSLRGTGTCVPAHQAPA